MGALAARAPKPSIREYEAIKNPVPIEKNNVEKLYNPPFFNKPKLKIPRHINKTEIS